MNQLFLSEVGNQNRVKRQVDIGLTFTQWPETPSQTMAYVASRQLDVSVGSCLLTQLAKNPVKVVKLGL